MLRKTFFPDKPTASSPGVLAMLADREWLSQIKFDGWRAMIRWDGQGVSLTSRHLTPVPATAALQKALYDALHGLPPCLLDGEWMGRRDKQPEGLRIFDLIEFDGEWIGGVGAWDRWMRVQGLMAGRIDGDIVSVVPATDFGYGDFFEFSKELPGAEGIVLKKKTSRFIGSVRRSVENPEWLKVKFREGYDGQRFVA